MLQRFNNSGEGAKELQETFNGWNQEFRAVSLQACYALIAGLFAAFGAAGALLANPDAVSCIVAVFILLGANLAIRLVIVCLLAGRVTYSEKKSAEWEKEFEKYKVEGGKWPYTATQEWLGHILRFTNFFGIIVAGVLLILAVLTGEMHKTPAAGTPAASAPLVSTDVNLTNLLIHITVQRPN